MPRIAKKRVSEAVVSRSAEFGEYLKAIGLSVDGSEDAWCGFTVLNAWLEERGEERIGPMGIQKVLLDARKRWAIVDAIGEHSRDPSRHGKVPSMVFDCKGGSQTNTVFTGNGRQINNNVPVANQNVYY